MRRVFLVVAAIVVACSSSSEPGASSGGSSSSSGGSSSGDGGSVEPSGPPALRFVGRFDTRDPAGPKAGWPGCRIIARFEGTQISVKLEELLEDWMDGGPSDWDVIVDGAITKKISMQAGMNDFELASGLAPGTHVVELYKRTETQNGVTRLVGFDYHGGTLLAPPVAPSRKIEIIGDSAAAGFGVEGVGMGPDCPGPDYGSVWQNFHKSFGAVLGETFDADLEGTVYSGKGFVKNIWRPDTETMPKIFQRANSADPSSTYDITQFHPDAIVIMMGGNDFAIGQPTDDGPASLDDFTAAYDGVVGTLRDAHPLAHIYLVVSPSAIDEEPAGRNTRTNIIAATTQIANDRTAKGDMRVHQFEPPLATAAELTGCDGHGSPEFHQRVANDLAAVIKGHTGW